MIATLKEAIHQLISDSKIPARTLAEEMGISYSYLMNAANPEISELKLAARLLIPLTRITGDFSAIDFIENSLGRTALPLPKGKAEVSEIKTKLFDSVGCFGALVKNATDALAGNKISAWEARELEQSGYELISKTLEFLQAVELCRKEQNGHV
ncbi:phage regulatory CII family protein [bacterium]|nr:phage regulatory CII family protein [bacterium]